MRIGPRIIIPVLAVQAWIGITEAWSIIRCHTTVGVECWPWFFSFTINFPASMLLIPLQKACNQYLGFYPALVLEYVLYVGLGTLWWSGLIHVAAWFISELRSQPQGPNA